MKNDKKLGVLNVNMSANEDEQFCIESFEENLECFKIE